MGHFTPASRFLEKLNVLPLFMYASGWNSILIVADQEEARTIENRIFTASGVQAHNC